MAVQAQYGGLAGVPASRFHGGGPDAEAQMRAFLAAGGAENNGFNNNNNNNCAAVVSGAHSELTCNNGAGAAFASRKRGREAEQYVSSSAALLPIPGMSKAVDASSRMAQSAMTSTSGRQPAASAASASIADGLVLELYRHSSDVDATVRMECERMRAALEQARKRQCQSLLRLASAAAARRLQEKEAELEAAHLRAAELEDQLRQAAAESQAWYDVARSNDAVAAGLRATLDHLLRAAPAPEEGFGESDGPTVADDALSCCFATNDMPKDDAASSPAGKWVCKACGEREASVLLLPCRHLCLCKGCEPRLDACPVCLAAKNASVHIAMN